MNHSKETLAIAAIVSVIALTGVALAIPQQALAHRPQYLFATGTHGTNVHGTNGANGVNDPGANGNNANGANGNDDNGANGISTPGVNGTSSNGVNGGNANGATMPKSGFFD
jgi:hypothetical protein